jgi:hypothetical protein
VVNRLRALAGVIFVHTNLPCTLEFDRRRITQRPLLSLPLLFKACFQELAAKRLIPQWHYSNPTLSATQSGLQRNRAALLQESLKIATIP